MFNFFKKKTIVDNAKDFEDQYKIAKIIIFKYLDIWFEQIFATPEWKDIFADKPDMHTTMAAEVMRYLLALEDTRNDQELQNEAVTMAKKHAEKWSDDAMNRDRDFCDFVIQTLRMDSVFNQYFNGTDWAFNDPRGKKVFDIIMKHGGKVKESPDPKKYEKLLRKWMLWSDTVDEKRGK